MTNEAVATVWLDGVQLDIFPGDVSDFDEVVRDHLARGGGWLFYEQEKVTYQLHVTASSSIIIRYPK